MNISYNATIYLSDSGHWQFRIYRHEEIPNVRSANVPIAESQMLYQHYDNAYQEVNRLIQLAVENQKAKDEREAQTVTYRFDRNGNEIA